MHTETAPSDTSRFLRLPDVKRRIGLGKTKIYAMVADGEFPTFLKLGRATVWAEDEIIAWQRAQRERAGK